MHILVVEDDPALQIGLDELLQRAGHRVTVVGDGILADDLIKEGSHDLVVLDLGLPGMDGLVVLRRMRQRKQTTPVLILSARDRASDRVEGLDAGADDYLDKPFERGEFEARVRALLRRTGSGLSQIGRISWSAETNQVWVDGLDLNLTRYDATVLLALLQRAGRIMTKAALAQRLAIDEQDVSDNAVEVYIYRLRTKLKGTGATIRTVRGMGYVLELDT
jgi:DNA-binding response OmpR family regulator